MSFSKSVHTAVHVEKIESAFQTNVPIKLYNFSLSTAPHTSKDDGQRTFEAVGCFSKCDDCFLNFPELLFIDSGQTEHYGDTLQEYTRQFVYRCAKQSQSREFDYFGIANYGDLISYYVSSYAVLLCPFGNFAMSPCLKFCYVPTKITPCSYDCFRDAENAKVQSTSSSNFNLLLTSQSSNNYFFGDAPLQLLLVL
jgi:hypothetical protein